MTKSRMAFLIESELERAELVLNAKAITDKLQGMAEDLAKVKADDIMPMLDHLRDSFGPASADTFSKVAGEKLDGLVQAIQDAKNAISGEVSRLEQAVNGGEANDMSADGAAMAAPAPMGDMGEPGLGAAEGEPGLDGADDLPEIPGDDAMAGDTLGADTGAAGRAKKESAVPGLARNIRALRESSNPDAMVLAVFRKLMESHTPARAMHGTARAFGIDSTDVLHVVRESKEAAKKKLAERGVSLAQQSSDERWVRALMNDIDVHADVLGKTVTVRSNEDASKAKAALLKHPTLSSKGFKVVAEGRAKPRVMEAVPQQPLSPADKRAQQAQQPQDQRKGAQKPAQQPPQKPAGGAPAAKAPAPAQPGKPAPQPPQQGQQGPVAKAQPGQKPGVGSAPAQAVSGQAPAFPGKTVTKVVAPESLMSKTDPLPKPAHPLMGGAAPKQAQPMAEGRKPVARKKKV